MPIHDPEARSIQARAAAHKLHSMYDSHYLTANAREAFNARFDSQVDPERKLPLPERQRRAMQARKAYFTDLAFRSVESRRRKRRLADTNLQINARDTGPSI